MLDPVSNESVNEVPAARIHPDPVADPSYSSYEHALAEVRRYAIEQAADPETARASFDHLMTHDSLTGLFNRAGFIAELRVLLAERAAWKRNRGILILDLDHFRSINVGLGIAAGDETLSIVAQRLGAAVRPAAVVARLSGVEFAVVDDFASAAEAQSSATELLSVLSAPMVVGNSTIEITVSIGVAMVSENETPDRLVGRAAAALHQAKKRGRNRCEVEYDDPDDGEFNRRGELRRAIEDREFRLFYQPQIDLSSGQMNGFEALVRWDHPDRGLLAPAAFIDFAEESGLILPLGAWVIDAAVAQQAEWHRSAPDRPPVRMSINISAIQLNDPRLEEMVTETLFCHNVDPGLLTLEITETALTEDPVAALRTLQILNSLGVRLSIDDFGTGHSSLTYLKRFPIHELKIDRSFIAGLTTDSKDRAIVASCIQLAQATNLIAVAEGVETPDQLHTLMALGCDLAQGYFYTRPMSAEDLEPWFVPRPDNVRLSEHHLINQ
ncbi:putative bifunctional diguanylate cyclase/phosphodiesterase [Arthrobacter sp. CAN_A1]|uniref:putative bifunctional diguanylate cyclase/phosphodiesterase n=1 Tax=Arthrobacter sp. CAN_A1 TaxID=2787717 RepID=UPI0018C9774C